MTGVVLASRSAVRRSLLENAGLDVVVDVAGIDESAEPGESETARARRLAVSKAQKISAERRGDIVVGCDQVGILDDGTVLDQCRTVDGARAQLLQMSGRTHTFTSVAALVRDCEVLAVVEESVQVTFRTLTPALIDAYTRTDEWRGCCGSYQIEHRGIQLVEKIDGSMHAILGLPLRPLLAAFRETTGIDWFGDAVTP